MPRSLSHSQPSTRQPPPGIGLGPPPGRQQHGQMHVLEQQQLQQRLQQGQVAVHGAPVPGRPAMNGQPPYHLQQQPPPGAPPGMIQPGQPGPAQQQPSGAFPQAGMTPQQQQQQVMIHPPYAHPGGSAQSSPHLQHAPSPYANGRPGPPGVAQRPQQPPQQQARQYSVYELLPGSMGHGPHAPAFAQAMAASGCAGRNPETLNSEEQVSAGRSGLIASSV